ncbi:right-handed parallel beta-helix repeat-containing protein [Lignipirellula cremea]|uniref:Right handed beta helix domain-containing protein n=1 Tax=Lignipirellula cremea TaxID=2528010 RepID=A0A518DNA8_9BACT|nr:right-handed parallel beta-helix repeat-containing protein [Lignipirellula cremea]QDU93322.1 hypothetical protein Pla8534_11020 [Lignipirellula cremea]
MPRLFAVLVGLAVFSSGWCHARNIYVNNVGGDDRNNGYAEATNSQGGGPCRTIAKALRSAINGDVIVLAKTSEPYRESITLQGGRHSGTVNNPFIILGNGAVLDGSAPIPDSDWNFIAGEVFRFDPPRKAYAQVFRDGRPLVRVPMPAAGLPELKPLEWTLFERAIYVRTENQLVPQSLDLSYASLPVGISLYECRNVRIYDLTVQGFQIDGVNCADSVFGAVLDNVVARGNGRAGVSVGGACRVRLKNCLAGDNGEAQVRTEGYCELELEGSELLDNTAPGLVQQGGRVKVTPGEERGPEPGATPLE